LLTEEYLENRSGTQLTSEALNLAGTHWKEHVTAKVEALTSLAATLEKGPGWGGVWSGLGATLDWVASNPGKILSLVGLVLVLGGITLGGRWALQQELFSSLLGTARESTAVVTRLAEDLDNLSNLVAKLGEENVESQLALLKMIGEVRLELKQEIINALAGTGSATGLSSLIGQINAVVSTLNKVKEKTNDIGLYLAQDAENMSILEDNLNKLDEIVSKLGKSLDETDENAVALTEQVLTMSEKLALMNKYITELQKLL